MKKKSKDLAWNRASEGLPVHKCHCITFHNKWLSTLRANGMRICFYEPDIGIFYPATGEFQDAIAVTHWIEIPETPELE
jgi:hypothetical protein